MVLIQWVHRNFTTCPQVSPDCLSASMSNLATRMLYRAKNVHIAQKLCSIFYLSTLSTIIHNGFVESCPPTQTTFLQQKALIHQVIHIIHNYPRGNFPFYGGNQICVIFVHIL